MRRREPSGPLVKVYVVIQWVEGGGGILLGVFATPEVAEEVAGEFEGTEIQEFNLSESL